MKRLLTIELLKIRNYPIFWVMTILYLFSCVGLGYYVAQAEMNIGMEMSADTLGFYDFPVVYQSVSYVFGVCMILLAMIMLIFTVAEFQNRTMRQSIINGLTKAEFIMGKIYLIIFLCLVSTVTVFLLSLIFGFIFTDDMSQISVFTNAGFVIGYFVQIFTFLMFGFMVGVLVRKSGVAIAIVAVYYLILEPIISVSMSSMMAGNGNPDAAGKITQFFPGNSIDNVIPNPLMDMLTGNTEMVAQVSIGTVGICLVWAVIFTSISYYMLAKRDV
jgi:ABC-2 type transport system permease protein